MMSTLAALVMAVTSEVQARIGAPGNLEELIEASDAIVIAELERGMLHGLAPAVLLLLLLSRRRVRLLFLGVALCVSCRGSSGAGQHFAIDVQRVLQGTCSEPTARLVVPAVGACYEPNLRTGMQYVMFLSESDRHYTPAWTAHSLLPIENGRVKATWRSDSGEDFTVEELAKILSNE